MNTSAIPASSVSPWRWWVCLLLMLATSVISAIGVDELMSFAGHIQTTNFKAIEVYLVCLAIYFAMTLALRSGARALGSWLFRRPRPALAAQLG